MPDLISDRKMPALFGRRYVNSADKKDRQIKRADHMAICGIEQLDADDSGGPFFRKGRREQKPVKVIRKNAVHGQTVA